MGGFKGIDKISSGDDMLLMYKIWKKHPQSVHYLKSKKAIISTKPLFTWKDFFMQRRRWASKTFYYDDKRVLVTLAFVYKKSKQIKEVQTTRKELAVFFHR